MAFTIGQAEGFLEVYRAFLQIYVRYERLDQGDSKKSLGSQVIEAYRKFIDVTPIEITRNKYVELDRGLLLDIIGSEEGLQKHFPSLEARTIN